MNPLVRLETILQDLKDGELGVDDALRLITKHDLTQAMDAPLLPTAPKTLRDEVALAVFPTLLAEELKRPGVLDCGSVVRDAYSWAARFLRVKREFDAADQAARDRAPKPPPPPVLADTGTPLYRGAE